MKKRLMLVGALIGIIHAINVQAAITLDFATSDGGLTGTGGWTYGGGSWFVNGSVDSAAYLETSAFTVGSSGQITGNFIHRYNFDSLFDGGQVQYQVNGGGWNTISANLITGSTYELGNPLNNTFISGQYAFTGESTGYTTPSFVTSSFTLGTGIPPYNSGGSATTFTVGDSVKFRFSATWDPDTFNNGVNPNWQVSSLSFDNLTAVPEPATTAAAVSGLLAAFAMLRRPSVRAKLGALIGR